MKNINNVVIVIGALIVVAVVVVAYIFSGKNEEVQAGEYDTFAQCLYESGMRMYGSATCRFCAQQREMFGPSVKYIREIECDPRNPLSKTELCIAKNIAYTPTWILEDKNSNETYRFEPGVQTLEKLSEVSGCPFVKDLLPG